MVDISILIVTYNCSADLMKCLESLRTHVTDISYEILIRDNASIDASELEVLSSDQIKIVFGIDNPGFGRANNEIAELARGRYLLLLNPDTILDENVPRQLLEHLNSHPEVGACAPRIRNLDGTRQFSWNLGMDLRWEFAETFYLQNIWRSRVERNLLRRNPSGPWSVDFSSGACLCLHSEVWRQTGGFDPDFFLNHEDIELCGRIRAQGKQVHVLPSIWITHADGGSQKKDWGRFVTNLLVAKRVYLGKRFRGPALVLALGLWRIRVLSRIALSFAFSTGKARTRFAGYIQAWKQASAC